MKALVKVPKVHGLRLMDVTYPTTNDNSAIVEVRYAGICGTDLPFYMGKRDLPAPGPVILGHEIAGVVCSLPKQERDSQLHIGDPVTVEMVTGCDQCDPCREDYKLACSQSERIGITVNGGFAGFVAIPIANVHRLPDHIPLEQGVFADPLACAFKGLEKVGAKQFSRVLILGSGIMGLLNVQLLQRLPTLKQVVVVDHHEGRLELAKRWGAITTPSISGRAVANGQFDLVVEASGNPELLTSSLPLLQRRGVLLLLGVHNSVVPIDVGYLLQREIEIIPSLCYNHQQMSQAIDLLAQQIIEVEPLISYIIPLEGFVQAFDLALQKRLAKVILKVR